MLFRSDPSTNAFRQVWVWEGATGGASRASATGDGRPGDGWSGRPVLSADGRRAAFLSFAPDLAAGDFNGGPDVFAVEVGGAALMLNWVLSAGRLRVEWPTRIGRTYAVEAGLSVEGPWEILGVADRKGTGANLAQELEASEARQFLRVRER